MTVDSARVNRLNNQGLQSGDYVIYWMQASQRVEGNDALSFAIGRANELRRPLVVAVALVNRYLGAGARHYRFMLQGLAQVAERLRERRIAFVLRESSPEELILTLGRRACCVIADRGYLRHQVAWYRQLAEQLPCPLIQIEANVVVPVEVASPKEEYAARTFRPKVQQHLGRFLSLATQPETRCPASGLDLMTLDASETDSLLQSLGMDPLEELPRLILQGGEHEARRLLEEFVEHRLPQYDKSRNDPSLDAVSHMSPYLHFGQISPIEIAVRVQTTGLPSIDAYLEELIVRRELAINMVHYNAQYDSLAVLPNWAQTTLAEHACDQRPVLYTRDELEAARTHDPYWNAAQREMLLTGKMHGYMRMYWGKKILEWSPDPTTAMSWMIYLNDAYELDGRDPNGYAGVAWGLGKHDQAWRERPIFGKVRYMNARGLERKYDMDAYVQRIDALEIGAQGKA